MGMTRIGSALRWLAVLLALFGTLALLHLALRRSSVYRSYDRQLRERQIDPTALFYSETPHTHEAGQWMRRRLTPEAKPE